MQELKSKLSYRFPELFVSNGSGQHENKQDSKPKQKLERFVGHLVIEEVNKINSLHWEMFQSITEIQEFERLNIEMYYATISAFIEKRENEIKSLKNSKK